MKKFTLITIYQSEISLSEWLNEVRQFVVQLIVIVPIAHRNEVNAEGVEIPIKWIDIEERNVCAYYLHTIAQLDTEWIINCSMNTKLTLLFFEELNVKIASESNKNNQFIAYPTKVSFIGKQLNYGGFTKEPSIICYHKNTVSKNTSIRTKKLNYRSTEWFVQTYDNLQLSFIWKAEVDSQQLFNKNKKTSYYRFFAVPFCALMTKWILKGGFLDGREGFSLAYLYALKGLNKELFLWKKHKNIP